MAAIFFWSHAQGGKPICRTVKVKLSSGIWQIVSFHLDLINQQLKG